jgi:16S rRNA (guanine966-N2)-methyltransferase
MRPTPDRVRETLFNWLQPYIAGRRCLDLFAGSGALGLEALSRGAASVCAIDSDAQAIAAIANTAREFGASGLELHCEDARAFLQQRVLRRRDPQAHHPGVGREFDLVFIDPPFDSDLAGNSAGLLESQGWLAPGALIYVEAAHGGRGVALPESWQQLKSGSAGVVSYHLYLQAGAGRLPE